MCRQVGIILGRKRRRADEADVLLDIFTEMLVQSEAGGPHATGVAVVREGAEPVIAKRPMPARAFTGTKVFLDAAAKFDDRATALIGHTRWRTVGSEKRNANNHPILSARCWLTHNGSIVNADELFDRLRLPRRGEVDSELLARMADLAAGAGGIDPAAFLPLVAQCRGRISAVLAMRDVPEDVVVLKGNRPIEFRYSRRRCAVAYATDGAVLDDAIEAGGGSGHDWQPMVVAPMTMLVFRHRDLFRPEAYRLRFAAQPRGWTAAEEGVAR